MIEIVLRRIEGSGSVSETILALLPTIESFEKSYSTDVIIFPGLVIYIKEQMVYRDYKLVPSFS